MASLFELNLNCAAKGSREVSSTLYQQLKSAIVEGRLAPGSLLPSTRSARAILGVSRNTAQDVYDRLRQEGLIVARHGSGTYVRATLEKQASNSNDHPALFPDRRINDFWLQSEVESWIGFWRETSSRGECDPIVADLRPALIDPSLFPHAIFRKAMARQLRLLETRPARSNSPQGNQGSYRLRRAIADHIRLTRAAGCSAEQVVVTSGAQQAVDLISRILVKPHKSVVAVEDPGYPPMRVPLAAAGAKLVPIRVDDEGIVVSEIPPETDIVCVCPSHQFPLGTSMTPARRRELVDFARRHDAVIIEDDYDGEFRFDGNPLEALRSDETSDVVFYVGSFSKSMFPSLRLGFVVPPSWAITALVKAKNATDWHCSIPVQLTLASFMLEGHLARHIARVRRIYSERRSHLLNLLEARASGLLDVIPSTYGMHICAVAKQQMDCEAISSALASRGVMIHALDRYFLGPKTCGGFVLGYAAVDSAGLDIAIESLIAQINISQAQSAAHSRSGEPTNARCSN